MKDLQLRIACFAKSEQQVSSLEQAIKAIETRALEIELRIKDVFRDLEPRFKDIENRIDAQGKDLERKVYEAGSGGDAVAGIQRTFEGVQKHFESQLCECIASVRSESAAWRDALRGESASWREACGEVRVRADNVREELQHALLQAREAMGQSIADAKGEIAAEKLRAVQLTDGLSEVKQQVRQHTEETNAKLAQSLNEMGWRLSRRIDEADAAAGETRVAMEDNNRHLAVLERALESTRAEVEVGRAQAARDKEDAAREAVRTAEAHRQAVLSQAVSQATSAAVPQALDAVKAKLEETNRATERCEESERKVIRAIDNFADFEKDIGRKFERWSAQAAEAAQARLQERLQEMLRAALGDVSAQVSGCVERHCDKALKAAQIEAQAEAKDDARRLKEECVRLAAEAAGKYEQALADLKSHTSNALAEALAELRTRLDKLASETTASTASLTAETARLEAQGSQQQAFCTQLQRQEASNHESVEQSLAVLRRSLEQQRDQLSEVCDRVTPSLRELQGALAEERKARGEEAQRLQERFHGFEGRSDEQLAAQRRADSTGRGLADGLQRCGAALAATERRLTGLEEALEERLHDLVHNEVMRGMVSHFEDYQRKHLQPLEGKVDKIVRNLHTPSGHEASFNAGSAGGRPGGEDREQWRQQFRASLGDSLYVKKALSNGGRAPSADCLSRGCREQRPECVHNDRLRRRGHH